ncbi:hypothetical protein V5P93_006464 [Actinokineospora auranticolor]|uniref:Immunity protein 42 of polymorphic toxin system n=1 Tax=Actinokineospora auranticolor TaxID=155976 RepID=A0A2S6GXI4_9PSEU|nr:hypothetical protein [Actinokineospora auranticolor]PPK69897.1 hypothetical protein CLV40_103507 [Actinokineospora auranticolor]
MVGALVFGSRAGFGVEFHVDRDPDLLCVDLFVGGIHVDARDNAFYPPLLVKKLKDELGRFRAPTARPADLTSSPLAAFRIAEDWTYDDTKAGVELAAHRFLEWGECTDDVLAFAFPDGDRIHLTCRVYGDEDPRASTVSRASLVETLEHSLVVAEREWSARLAIRLRANDTP